MLDIRLKTKNYAVAVLFSEIRELRVGFIAQFTQYFHSRQRFHTQWHIQFWVSGQ